MCGAWFTSSRPSRGMHRVPLILRARAPSSTVSNTRWASLTFPKPPCPVIFIIGGAVSLPSRDWHLLRMITSLYFSLASALLGTLPGDDKMRQGANVVHQPLTRDNLGRPDLVAPVINYLKASFQHWFDSASTTLPAYETAWGGVINKAGANNYGYFLNIAAVIAKFDGNWLNQHRDYINWFARYIPFLPFLSLDPLPPLFSCR